jgi:hypothetical protein
MGFANSKRRTTRSPRLKKRRVRTEEYQPLVDYERSLNKTQLQKLAWKRVKLRPMAKRFDHLTGATASKASESSESCWQSRSAEITHALLAVTIDNFQNGFYSLAATG